MSATETHVKTGNAFLKRLRHHTPVTVFRDTQENIVKLKLTNAQAIHVNMEPHAKMVCMPSTASVIQRTQGRYVKENFIPVKATRARMGDTA